jgi:hypothetical protein
MRRFVTAALAAVLLSATVAQAAEPPLAGGYNSKSVVGWAILGWSNSVGLGASFQLPLVPQGLIHDPGFKLHDSLDFDVGVDYLSYWDTQHSGPYSYDVSEFNLHAGVLWNFWLTPKVALYPKVGLGYSFAHYSYSPDWPPGYAHSEYGGLYPELAVGGQLKLGSAMSLRGELGWSGLKVGLGFDF